MGIWRQDPGASSGFTIPRPVTICEPLNYQLSFFVCKWGYCWVERYWWDIVEKYLENNISKLAFLIPLCFYSSNPGQFLFSSVHKAPLNTMTFEYFKPLLRCMTVLDLIGSGVTEDEGSEKKMGARHLFMPAPVFQFFLSIDLCSTRWKFR